jgi:hypothetical protein
MGELLVDEDDDDEPPSRRRHARSSRSTGSRRGLLIALSVVGVAALVVLALALTVDDSTTSVGSSATTTSAGAGSSSSSSTASTAPAEKPGPPPGWTEPPVPTEAPKVSGFHQENHAGFERVTIDFTGPYPPPATMEEHSEYGLVRVLLDAPKPTAATDAPFATFDSAIARGAFFVSDGTNAWIDVHTNVGVSAEVYRLGEQPDGNGGTKGVIVADLTAGPKSWTKAAIGYGGVILAPADGSSVPPKPLTVEGYGERTDGKGVVRVTDASGAVKHAKVTTAPSGSVEGYFKTHVDLSDLPPGSYLVTFTSEDPTGHDQPQPDTTVFITVTA